MTDSTATRRLNALAELVSLGGCRAWAGALKVGVDPGTANIAVVVLDENNTVLYSQLVSEIKNEPHYEAALEALA